MFFFFFKQKTAYEMRISDWSSDVCSSDLMQLKAQEMNRQDVNQINGEAGAGYDVDRPPKPRGERYARYIEQSDDGRQQPDEPVSHHRRILPSAQHRRCDMQGDESHRRQQPYSLPPCRSRKEKHPAPSHKGPPPH